MKYAGFWVRFLAIVIDTALFAVPTLILSYYVYPESAVARAWTIGIENVLMCAYQVYFLATTGQTFGKYIARIRVIVDGAERVGYHRSVVRNAWYIAGAMGSISESVALFSVSAIDFARDNEYARAALLMAHRPAWAHIVNTAITAWVVAEIVCLLKSSQKRSIHDFMAKTVVVYAQSVAQADVPAGRALVRP